MDRARSCAEPAPRGQEASPQATSDGANGGTWDFIVVGSGAGGGPLAARLAEAGHNVLLLEAGGRDASPEYTVPAFHGFAAEDPAMRWDYFVRQYQEGARAKADPKFTAE